MLLYHSITNTTEPLSLLWNTFANWSCDFQRQKHYAYPRRSLQNLELLILLHRVMNHRPARAASLIMDKQRKFVTASYRSQKHPYTPPPTPRSFLLEQVMKSLQCNRQICPRYDLKSVTFVRFGFNDRIHLLRKTTNAVFETPVFRKLKSRLEKNIFGRIHHNAVFLQAPKMFHQNCQMLLLRTFSFKVSS